MITIEVRNVEEALHEGVHLLTEHGIERDSRNGKVLVAPCPVTTVYDAPRERVLLSPVRDANPFFHLLEALWMLSGRNDVKYVADLVSTMAKFSDDGKTFNSAYGYRWRHHFGKDQVAYVINALKANPDDRRCVISMWDGSHDLGLASKDLPCNTQVYVSVNTEGKLDITVVNRSNDMVWGAYGANAVHFSVLQEYIAAGVGVPVGRYWQVSNNFHAYEKTFAQVKSLNDSIADPAYDFGLVGPFPLVSTDLKTWDEDLSMFMDKDGGLSVIGYRDPFFRRVAMPMLAAYTAWQDNDGEDRYLLAYEALRQCVATDWQRAGIEWIERRHHKWRSKNVAA